MKKVQQGFTLIELMIVVAIIGILAAVAIPAYTDYTARAKVTEAVGALAAAKTSVSEYYISEAVMPADATAAGINTGALGSYVNGVAYTKTSDTVGVIEVTLTSGITTDLNGKKFKMTGTGSAQGVAWVCATTDAPAKYLPASCR
ncbi:pilin [Aromatoleum aromaticum]|uniref:Fimbrial protein PilE (MS11 antigen) n=1 Tax=Aromatoleum aromaticum (strain DSM 19018 / LMG 30748 / EbN1) TaxID=76114 RepID=Q5P2X6_AROAE|nr:pilin [Aromatoleum aromaticum]NMG53433.1 prepilin-type N-terminal cleavage/methylation domain-containing protein [Aromatoleum aromaticum]CAI08338.1 fimbrial protein precursor PilE (MS11 antigen) [Aromatoleum aromaticum EbN1]